MVVCNYDNFFVDFHQFNHIYSQNEFSDHTAHSENFDDVENVLEDSF